MRSESMRDRFVRVTTELLDQDPRAAIILAEIGVARFEESGARARHSGRVVNVGIREQLMIGVAAGMALEGLRPIVHSYAPFLVERPFEQIKLDLGHQGVGAILVSIAASYDAAGEGRTHQCPADVALVSSLPGWQIHVPGHPDEAEALLRVALEEEGCVYIRLSDQVNTGPVKGAAAAGLTPVRHGSPGAPVVVAVGPMLDRTLEATAGLDLTVLYAVTVNPLNAEVVARVEPGSAILVVEPYLEGTTLPALVRALGDRPRRFLSIGVPNVENRHYGTAADHDRAHGLDAEGIRRRLTEFLAVAQPAGAAS